MGITQLNTDLSSLGTVIVCEFKDNTENDVIIVIDNFAESINNINLVNTHITNNLGASYQYIVSMTLSSGLFKTEVNRDDGKSKLIFELQ